MNEEQRRWLRGFVRDMRERVEALEHEVAALKKRRTTTRPSPYSEQELSDAREVHNKVNQHAGTSLRFESSPGRYTQHVKVIVSRLRKGATSWQMRLIAWHKCAEFTSEDGIGRGYCKPSTLFSDAHFDDYLDAATLAYAEAERMTADEAMAGPREHGCAQVGELVRKLKVVK